MKTPLSALALLAVLSAPCLSLAQPVVPAAVNDVTIGGPFWGPRMAAVRAGTLAANRHQCDITGRIANFENAARKLKGGTGTVGEFQGLLFNDSDFYKMMEGWAYLLATEKEPAAKAALDKDLDALIAKVAAAQLPDGYINTYYTLKVGIEKRLTNEVWDHETYCMGHLIEAGVAHFQATGKRNLLDVAIKAADFLNTVYAPGKLSTPSGHQEIELALVRLADATADRKYLTLATRLVEMRGRPHTTMTGETVPPWGDYAQDHLPMTEQREAAGHAVRAGYLYAAATDLAARGHREYLPALGDLWKDITQRRIFVTGGIGPSGHNEGFTVPYDIPVKSAYQETCASIALCMWAQRMFILDPDAKYMQQYEQTLYNAVLAGVSLDGSKFFYVNPMATRGGHARQDWFGCACCPPNVLRFFGSLGKDIYAVKGDTVFINLFVESQATLDVGGKPVKVEQKTEYPFGGATALTIHNGSDKPLTVATRLTPGMAPFGAKNNHSDGYRRSVIAAGETKTESFTIPLPVSRVYSDPRVKASVGRAAIMRGPLVYAVEAADHGGNVQDLVLPASAEIAESKAPDGTPILTAAGFRASGSTTDGLYTRAGTLTPASITLRPYYMWGNRKPGDGMKVWIPETPQVMDPLPIPGIKASASFVGNGDGVQPMFDRIVPEIASDASMPRFTFWPKNGGGTDAKQWVRYDLADAKTIGEVSIWWFDDTGSGGCRLPKSFEVSYLDGEEWKTVRNPTGGTISINAPSVVRFNPVSTKAMRLDITLPDGMSSGILEWSFGG
jgi:DUF1680 family protein